MDTLSEFIGMLLKNPLFVPLPQEELRLLASRMQAHKYRKGEAIIQTDDHGNNFYMIRSGEVKVVRSVAAGGEAIVSVLGPNDFFGEMALLDGRPRSATVYALEATEVLVLSREDFLGFLHAHPAIAIEVIIVLADRIRSLNEQMEESLLDLPHRLARRLLDLSRRRGVHTPEGIKIQIPITQSELAGMVRASRQRVNRLLAEWQDLHLIRLGRRGEITLLHPGALEEIAR